MCYSILFQCFDFKNLLFHKSAVGTDLRSVVQFYSNKSTVGYAVRHGEVGSVAELGRELIRPWSRRFKFWHGVGAVAGAEAIAGLLPLYILIVLLIGARSWTHFLQVRIKLFAHREARTRLLYSRLVSFVCAWCRYSQILCTGQPLANDHSSLTYGSFVDFI